MILLSSVIGTILEWYEFSAFAAFTSIIGELFYPTLDSTSQLLSTLTIYASGFLMRPIGGIFFGFIGEKKGRKYALTLSIVMMAIPTAIMGLLPSYHTIGIYAPIILMVLRLIQGFSMGGEFTSSMVFMVEHSARSRWKYLSSCLAPLSLVIGVALGSIAFKIVTALCSKSVLYSIGWRIPFLISIFGSMLGMWMRKTLSEPQEYEDMRKNRNDDTTDITTSNSNAAHQNKYIKECLYVINIDMLVAVGFFFVSAFMQPYLSHFLKFSIYDASSITVYSLLFMACTILLSGTLCDILKGHTIVQITACILLCITSIVTLFISTANLGYCMIAISGFIGIYFGPIPCALSELFPRKVRLSRISIMHNVAMTLFGGPLPKFLMSAIVYTGNVTILPISVLCVASCISAIGVWKARTIKGRLA